jgi:hypothetical protein
LKKPANLNLQLGDDNLNDENEVIKLLSNSRFLNWTHLKNFAAIFLTWNIKNLTSQNNQNPLMAIN